MIAAVVGQLMLVWSLLLQTRPADVASMDELRAMFAEGKHQQVVRQATKIAPLGGETGKRYDKHEVLRLKAESHLRLRQNPLAIGAFEEAARIAPDAAARDRDRATIMLVRRCPRSTYSPKTPGESSRQAAIDILEPASRQKAFEALLADERAAAEPALKAARESDKLVPVVDAIERVVQLGLVERAATDSAKESEELLEPFASRARAIIDAELKRIDQRVEEISKSAEKRKKMGSSKTYRKQGLAPTDPKELAVHVQACAVLAETSSKLSALLPSDAAELDELRLEAQRLARRAHEVLTADYSGNFDRS